MSAITDLEKRITTERQSLKEAEARERTLTASRIQPLEAGDDAALDRIEADIDHCRGTQLRIQERIQLLERSLDDAKNVATSEQLDRIRDEAEQHRKAAERVLRTKYPKLARDLAAVLEEVARHESAVSRANTKLERNGRDLVPSTNAFRNRPGYDRYEMKVECIGPRDPRHPEYEFVEFSHGGRPYHRDTKEPVMAIDMEIEERTWIGHFAPESLLSAVSLPALFEDAMSIWPPTHEREFIDGASPAEVDEDSDPHSASQE